MELTLISRSKRIKEKVERDHYWYDSVQKKMLHERGGEMRFKYDSKQKRSIPYIVDHEEWVYRNDYPDIKKWVNKNRSQFDLEIIHDIPNRHITLQVPSIYFNEIQADLYRNNITSDWDAAELRKEQYEWQR